MVINNFYELKEEVKNRLSVVEELREITYIDSKGDGICPFHSDRKKGSFKVNPKTNRYKCFACEAGGDPLNVVMHKRGISLVTAVYEKGYELGLICEDEMINKRVMPNVRAMKGTKNSPAVVKANYNKPIEKVIKAELTEEEINLYDIAYRVLSAYCGLDEADKYHLLNDRKINPDKLNDYFSLRDLNNKEVVVKTVSKLKSLGITEEQILNVPGFAYTKDKKIYIATFIRGLAMKIRNSNGKVIGIQIRTTDKDKKYIWLSSSNKGGKGSSTPVSIEYSKMTLEGSKLNLEATVNNSGDSILITEGKFKAEALSNKYQNIAFGIAGINNWKGKVKKDFSNITNQKEIKNIVLYADADCCYNPTIFIKFKEMIEVELKDAKQDVYVAHWNIKHGKGIDDVIHSNNDDKVKYLELKEYAELFYSYLEDIKQYDINDVNVNKDLKTEAYNKMFSL